MQTVTQSHSHTGTQAHIGMLDHGHECRCGQKDGFGMADVAMRSRGSGLPRDVHPRAFRVHENRKERDPTGRPAVDKEDKEDEDTVVLLSMVLTLVYKATLCVASSDSRGWPSGWCTCPCRADQ